jgi:hypothetical protein
MIDPSLLGYSEYSAFGIGFGRFGLQIVNAAQRAAHSANAFPSTTMRSWNLVWLLFVAVFGMLS